MPCGIGPLRSKYHVKFGRRACVGSLVPHFRGPVSVASRQRAHVATYAATSVAMPFQCTRDMSRSVRTMRSTPVMWYMASCDMRISSDLTSAAPSGTIARPRYSWIVLPASSATL